MIYLISHARVSGPVNQALNILNGLKLNNRIDGSLVTLAPEIEGNTWLNRFSNEDIKIYSLQQSFWKTLWCVPKLRKYLRNNEVDVIHSSGFRANVVSMFMPSRYVKVSTQRSSPADIAEKLPKAIRPFIIWLYLQLIKRIPVNVACSKSLSNVFLHQFRMKMPYVQNGVNTNYFKPLPYSAKRELRTKLDLPLNRRIYLILGSLNKRKNNELIIEVANTIVDKPIEFVFVGSGPEEDSLKKLANSPHICFRGTTTFPLDYLQAADVLISSSLAEGLPNTVLEAMACGLPCILSDIEPHRELIEDSDFGVLFDLKQKEQLKNEILNSLLWDDSMSSNARKVAVSKFDIRVLAANYEDLYVRAFNRR